ncbi:hypothetical protein ACIBI4_00400 [Streptomyces sp. NPDC050418]|uniref:hypothetical protein n=1 Tax=Streptomyces sp. NPDC050418 TaxID=3365612 RepID=UPI0037B5B311
MEEGDRCVEEGSGDSYGYEDIADRQSETDETVGLVGLGLGGVMILGAVGTAVSAAREAAERKARDLADAAKWPRPEDPGLQEAHSPLPAGGSVTLFTHAMRYTNDAGVERWASWRDIIKVTLSQEYRQDHVRIDRGSGHYEVRGPAGSLDFGQRVQEAVAQAHIAHILETLEDGGVVNLNPEKNLRLTFDGFRRTLKGKEGFIPWSLVTGIVLGRDLQVRITVEKGQWSVFNAHGPRQHAAFEIAERLWSQAAAPHP